MGIEEENYNSIWEKKEHRELLDVIRMLKKEDDAKAFLRDLLTNREIEELSMRWKTARLLYEGVPYTEIAKLTGLSSTTIARISKWLSEGNGGYKRMVQCWKNGDRPVS